MSNICMLKLQNADEKNKKNLNKWRHPVFTDWKTQ